MKHLARASLVGAILGVLAGMLAGALQFGSLVRLLTVVAVVAAAGVIAPDWFQPRGEPR